MSHIGADGPAPWYAPMVALMSAGRSADRAARLADLHARRAIHQGQFFTPNDIASCMWELALASMGPDAANGLRVLDSSIGSGRLVQFVRRQDAVYGCDVDLDCIDALGRALRDGGFEHHLEACGLESMQIQGMDVALINPPFSLHIESPLLRGYPCCAYGRFGPQTSTVSHWYALYQALDAARVVVALLPQSAVERLGEHPDVESRVHGIVHLPGCAFEDEGARVETSIVCLGTPRAGRGPMRVSGLEAARANLFALRAVPRPQRDMSRPDFRRRSVDSRSPSIVGPVTGDTRVRVYRSGRQIKLGFACAYIEARVRNTILERRLDTVSPDGHRYPQGIEFSGSARLLVEVLLSGPSALHYLDRLCDYIRAAGGSPAVDRDLIGYMKRRWRAVQVERTPLQRTIYDPHGEHGRSSLDGSQAQARRHHLTDPSSFSSPMVRAGQVVTLIRAPARDDERYCYDLAPTMPPLSVDELRERLHLPALAAESGVWSQIEPGRAVAYPARADAIARRLTAQGADAWLGSWAFQRQDVIELCMTRGAVAGHMMGLGKSRIAAGCCLAGGRHNAIVVEAGLLSEMLDQFRGFGLPEDLYQVITTWEHCRALRRINLISYQTLRKAIVPGATRSFASVLRRRFHTVCADEGSLVSHSHTQQTRALYQLSPKRRIALDGTPIPNLPRNLLPLVCWVSREGTASQPFGMRSPYITPNLFATAVHAQRGIDRFRDLFVVTEWVTHQFEDSLEMGGKREIPSLANLDHYRDFVGRHVLRRVWGEPAVAAHVDMPEPRCRTVNIDWDNLHLEFYTQTAMEFVEWYRGVRPEVASKRLNIVTVLLRLNAACRAASIPQELVGPHRWTGGLTSKQRWCVSTLSDLADKGTPSLCYFESPRAATLVAGQLRAKGLEVVEYTGLRSRTQRDADIARFRDGRAQLMLMTYGVGSRGLNLPQANHVLFYDRMWSPRQEQQALHRALRVGRNGVLKVTYAHLEGSVDSYKSQMVAFKRDTSSAGLDFATPEFVPSDFEHWLAILDAFCESIGRARLQVSHGKRAVA